MPDSFMPQLGHYSKLVAYRKAECIYDVTYYFVNNHLAKGSAAATASRETEIKLYNVAKASLQELLADYGDFLRVRGLELWPKGSPKAEQARRVCKAHPESEFFRERMAVRSAGTIANIAIVLIHQADYLLARLIESAKKRFLEEGGIREQMTRARLEYRKNNGRK